ncbi:MAG: carbamoyltransferase HypF [Chloroflexi bacterium]|nr:carbamoyltransferase HypF [Chloroflexota bacterium]
MNPGDTERLQITIQGAVQGVGFRPFVYRLATEAGLPGWVRNGAQGVLIEVEGHRQELQRFLNDLETGKPPLAIIQSLEFAYLDRQGYEHFEILHSDNLGAKSAFILPDIATCEDCVREVCDPADRRFRYPFTNCTNCGPRFSIIRALPYDRPNTSMRHFRLCSDCGREYADPLDRRFHAQPNACPRCGPRLTLWDATGRTLARDEEALQGAVQAIREGHTVAVKGLGGFHLLVDAQNAQAVRRLRHRKPRPHKPFALMYPTLKAIRADCFVDEAEARWLRSPECPIVLLLRRPEAQITTWVAPDNPTLGVMLPYTPLHHLLMAALDTPVVATSGNRTDEPITTDEHQALGRLRGFADLFLVHDRPIVRHVDDSVLRIIRGQPLLLRRARGFAPLPLILRRPVPPILALGAHLKNCVALAFDRQAFISQHIGDLSTFEAHEAFRQAVADLQQLYEVAPRYVAHDLHPDYLSTQYAKSLNLPAVAVQHHHAHLAACLAENEVEGPALGITWDGTGYGPDGTIWGGEFLLGDAGGFRRVAHLRPFRLPGGDQAVREPRRSALGILYALFGSQSMNRDDLAPVQSCSAEERRVFARMLSQGLNAPVTTSAGRLFDAVAALTGLCQHASFEAQAAMALEFAVDETEATAYHFDLRPPVEGDLVRDAEYVVDWEPVIYALLADRRAGVPPGVIAARFHNGLAEVAIAVARAVGERRVALSGGVFQNRCLLTRIASRLEAEGFRPYVHQRVPPNDGGIALGQVAVAAARFES